MSPPPLTKPPFFPPRAVDLARVSDPAIEARYRRKRLLVVDDDASFRLRVAQSASEFWVEVVEVGSCADARGELAGERAFAAALLDVRLINGSGLDLYRAILARAVATQVVFLTGYDSHDLRREIEDIGPARVHDKSRCSDSDFLRQLFVQLGFSALPATE
jgi:DNA-binding NarL/FixJ family response regulator